MHCKHSFRILTGKKYCQIKLQHLIKSPNMVIWVVGTLNQFFMQGC